MTLSDVSQLKTVSKLKWPRLALITLPCRKDMDIAIPRFFKCTRKRLQLMGSLMVGPVDATFCAAGSEQVALLVNPKTTKPKNNVKPHISIWHQPFCIYRTNASRM